MQLINIKAKRGKENSSQIHVTLPLQEQYC